MSAETYIHGCSTIRTTANQSVQFGLMTMGIAMSMALVLTSSGTAQGFSENWESGWASNQTINGNNGWAYQRCS